MTTEGNSIFQELNAQIKRSGSVPDTITIGGRKFRAENAGPEEIIKDWKSPDGKIHKDVPHEYVTINLANYAGDIKVDNVVYFHGTTRLLPKPVADVVREVCAGTWRHDAQTGGAFSFGGGGVRRFTGGGNLGFMD